VENPSRNGGIFLSVRIFTLTEQAFFEAIQN